MTTETMQHTSESSDSGFTRLGELLSVEGVSGYVCERCHDSGSENDEPFGYNCYGVPAVKEFCDCQAGERLRREVEEAKQRAAAEAELRRLNRIEMYRDCSQIPLRMRKWSLDSYPGDPRLRDLARQFVEQESIDDQGRTKIGLLLLGNTGVGKTGLAVAIANAFIERCTQTLFWETGSFLRAIRATFGHESEKSSDSITGPARSAKVLVLDDIGDVGRGGSAASDFARAEIFDLVNYRYNEMLVTVFTSNLTAKQMTQQFGERTWWRIADMCLVAEVGGRNLRA